MPIRLPDIPQLNPVNINAPGYSPVMVDPRAAAAPAMALGNVAQSISNAGEMFHNIALQTQKLENGRMESEARMNLARDYAALDAELQNEMDPGVRAKKRNEFLASYKSRMDSPEYAPAVRDSLVQHFDEFATRQTIQGTADDARLAMKRSGQQFDLELEQAPDLESANATIDRFAAASGATPEEAAKLKYQAKRKFEHQGYLQSIQDDPRTWLEQNGKSKPPAGVDLVQWEKYADYAKGRIAEDDSEISDTIIDGIITGNVTSADRIKELTSDLRPLAQKKLLDAFDNWNAKGAKEQRADPKNIAATVGQFYATLSDWQPDEEGPDPQGVDLRFAIESLPEGHPLRDKMRDSMAARKSRLVEEVKTKADQGRESLKQAADRGDFGPLKTPVAPNIETRAAVKKGFLKDIPKLQSLGFSQSQAEDIREAAKDPAMGQKKFTELWKNRPQQSVNATPFDIAVSDALRLENAEVQWKADLAPEVVAAHEQATRAYGEALIDFEKWIKLHPDANDEAIGGKLRELGSKSARVAPTTGPVKAPPGRETGMNGAGVNPYVSKLWGVVSAKYPSVENWGIWGDEKHKARKSDHNTGDAIDIAIKGNDGAKVTGEIVANATANNVKYIIHAGKIWKPSTGWADYSGSNPHDEHVHVSFNAIAVTPGADEMPLK
jgi:hypothetical protein